MIYLDYNATTPVDERVLAAMLPFFTEVYANASSTDHRPGDKARRAVEAAREQVSDLIDCRPDEVVFTSGATEANNLAILGVMNRAAPDAEILVSAVEHPAVLEPARRFGDRLRIAPVDARGVIDLGGLRTRISDRTALVSVMAANNETGALQPVDEIAHICAEAQVPLHVDAAQAVGRIPFSVRSTGAALVSFSAHKMYGPKGAGALYVRRRPRVHLAPLAFGGGHERQLRPGTLNVPGIVGLGAAAALACSDAEAEGPRQGALRRRLLDGLRAKGTVEVVETAPAEVCLPQTLHVRFVGISAQALMREVSDSLALATGSACSTTSVEPSHVLLAQGLSRAEVSEAVRLSIGRPTSQGDVDRAIDELTKATSQLALLRTAA